MITSKQSTFIGSVFFALLICMLWSAYYFLKVNNSIGLISDEVFYVTADISEETKRIVYLSLVRLFELGDGWRFVLLFGNLIALVGSFFLIKRLYWNNAMVAFAQVVYLAGVATYIFRDIYILLFSLLFILVGVGVLRETRLLIKIGKLSLWAGISLLLFDLRPHFLFLLACAFLLAHFLAMANTIPRLLLTLVIIGITTYIGVNYALNHLVLRNMTILELLELFAHRREFEYSAVNLTMAMASHYLSPLPWSLVQRMLDPSIASPYGNLDDLLRLVYKLFFYVAVATCVLNFRKCVALIQRDRITFFVLLSFSLSNAITYVMFNPMGGHERVKIVSTLFIFYLLSGIVSLGNSNAARAGQPKVGLPRYLEEAVIPRPGQ